MSIKGIKFTVFSKSPSFNVIPFDYRLRDYYQDHFYVRTWTRPQSAPPICDNYKILNVLKVDFKGISFDDTKEHSKWAVGIKKNIICFSDLNHTTSQINRGGNIVCFRDDKLARIMRKSVQLTDKCF